MSAQQKWRIAASRAFLAACVVDQMLKIKKEAHLFGTSRRMFNEIETMLDKPPKMVLRPESPVRWVWQIIIAFMLVYNAIAMPLQIAFQESPNSWRVAFDLIIDFFFLMDVILSFFTGYRDMNQGGSVVLDHRKIAGRYLRTWFLVDLSASFPWQLLEILTSQGKFLYFKMLRIFRLLQLLKYFKLVKTKKKQRCRINDSIRRILQATMLVIFFSHLVACLWFLLAKLNNFHPDTWVARAEAQNASLSTKYLMSYYWAIQTVTTVGFGDFPSKTTGEMLLSLFWMIFGVGFYSYVMGNFSSMLSSIDSDSRQLRKQIEVLDKFTSLYKIPDRLYERIRRHIQENMKNESTTFQKQELINSLPLSLKAEVINHTHGEIINELNFFQDTNLNFKCEVVSLLRSISFFSFEIIYREDDLSDFCYFILGGMVVISTRQGVPYRKLMKGMHFGEIQILANWGRKSSAIAVSKCDLLCLSKEDLIYVMRQFPEEAKLIKQKAFERCKFFEEERRRIEITKPHPVFKKLLEDGGVEITTTQARSPNARKDENCCDQVISEKEEDIHIEPAGVIQVKELENMESSKFDSLLMKEILATEDPLPPQSTQISNFFSTLPSLDDMLLRSSGDENISKEKRSPYFTKQRESKFAKRRTYKQSIAEEDSHKAEEEMGVVKIFERVEGLLGNILRTMQEANELQSDLTRSVKQATNKLDQIQSSQIQLLRK